MTINKNSVEQINVALLDMDKKIKSAISNGTSASDFKNLEASVESIKRNLNETTAGLESGKTYNINISGNAATATRATSATSATTADKATTATTANHATTADTAGTADRATSDANGNNIVNTYATKTELKNTTTKTFDLNTVSSYTTKYIKLGTFHWSDNNSLICGLYGNNFHDKVNINILNGNANSTSVCGYYSTNSRRTQAIIVKRGDNWSSDIEIYLQVAQETNLSIGVTIDERYQDKINISESTTAPGGKLETITFNNINGMFTGNIDANNLPRIKYADYQIPSQTFTQFQQVPIELSKFSSEVTPNNVLCFMVIYWTGVQLIASGDWGSAASSGLKCSLIPLGAGTGWGIIRCVYMV